ncbi:hypothetical protein [Fodinibius sediminis]|uniref:O-Antigen ligase n=1 Tax=Fodinibius sediminis TaxID=1214077 RepID=A0A521F321_9BACT|nr:hypothetical protein [Fodinibius sediminis]SMO90584.1 hypothetical protein SAMN06265218_12255 [Fodinibius sediminis]
MIDPVKTYHKTETGRRVIDTFFKCWALVLPITSVLLVPFIQGTTPAYMMAFLSVPLIVAFATVREIKEYFYLLLLIAIAYITLNLVSQFLLSLYGHMDLSSLPLVDPLSFTRKFVLRPTLFTQSLYLAACLLTFLFVCKWYHPSWDPYIFAGILLLVAYGFYEVFYFWLTGTSGDFLSNRVFNERYFGSSTQVMNIAGLSTLRMKSLTGEASMFAFTVLPYWVLALHKQKYLIGGILTLALLFSTSTTAILGIFTYLVVLVFSGKVGWKYLVAGGAGIVLITIIKYQAVFSVFNELILKKLSGASISGNVRLSNMINSLTFWWEAPLPTKIFGLGFGYIRSTDFFSTILVNNGLLGLTVFLTVFAYPILILGRTSKEFGLKAALIIILVTMLIAVTEYTYLPTWLFLGMSYHYLPSPGNSFSKQLFRLENS